MELGIQPIFLDLNCNDISHIYFRHITIFIHQENWPEFVQESPTEFNEIFKSCVRKIAIKLEDHFKMNESKSAGDSEKDPKISLLKDFETLYSNMAFSDVELEVEGKTLKAHKLILSSN
jgi:hypothetical protein